MPADLAAPCPDVTMFDSDSWDDLSEAYIDLVFLYGECKARHKHAVEALHR